MATNAVYQKAGTAVVFENTGGDVVLTLKNVANGAGRQSAQWDRGGTILPVLLKVEVTMKYAAGVTIGLGSRIYVYGTGTSANVDNGTSDAAIAAETLLNNFAYVGANLASANTVGPFNSSHLVEVYGRYISFAVWNASGQTIENVDSSSLIRVTPYFSDIQAAA